MRVDLNLIRAVLAHVEAETLKDFLDDAASLVSVAGLTEVRLQQNALFSTT